MICAYCKKRRAVQTDHFVKRAQARRRVEAARERENPRYKAPACRSCNEAIGTRCFVPPGFEDRIPELEALTFSRYAVYDGAAETLRQVVR
jgi:hypothetical protein